MIHVVGNPNGCPSPTQVSRALNDALTLHQADTNPSPDGDRVSLTDEGLRYRVVIEKTSLPAVAEKSEFTDETRQCEERARVTAVFLALLLEPPFPKSPPESSPPVSPPLEPPHLTARAKPVDSSLKKRKLVVQLEFAGVLDGTPDSHRAISGGASLRASLGLDHFAIVLGISGTSPTTLAFSHSSAHLERLPIDVDLRGALRVKRFELTLDLGFVTDVLFISGDDITVKNHGVRVDFGLRVALEAKVWIKNRVAPFVALQALISPIPIEFSADPYGSVGATPYLWLGGLAGLAIRLH